MVEITMPRLGLRGLLRPGSPRQMGDGSSSSGDRGAAAGRTGATADTAGGATSSPLLLPEEEDPVVLLELGRREALAIDRLEQSNTELLGALLAGGEDADFRAAVEENAAVLQRKRARAAAIGARLRRLGVEQLDVQRPSQGEQTTRSAASENRSEAGVDAALGQVTALLGQVKRKAAELAEGVVLGDFANLAIRPRLDASYAHDSAAALDGSTQSSSGSDRAGQDFRTFAREAAVAISAGITCDDACLDEADAALASAELGALLRGVKRKAEELEVVVLSENAESLKCGAPAVRQRREPSSCLASSDALLPVPTSRAGSFCGPPDPPTPQQPCPHPQPRPSSPPRPPDPPRPWVSNRETMSGLGPFVRSGADIACYL